MQFRVFLVFIMLLPVTIASYSLSSGADAWRPQEPPAADTLPVNDFQIVFPAPTDAEKDQYLLMPPADQARLLRALENMKAVWANADFSDQVQHRRFQPYGGADVTPLAVWRNITAPHPKILTLYLCTDADETTATATTAPVLQKTCLFPKYLHNPSTTPNLLVNTLSHEYTHTKQAGQYTHSYLSKCLWGHIGVGCHREDTVPYAVGDMAEAIANKLFPGGKADANRPALSRMKDKVQ